MQAPTEVAIAISHFAAAGSCGLVNWPLPAVESPVPRCARSRCFVISRHPDAGCLRIPALAGRSPLLLTNLHDVSCKGKARATPPRPIARGTSPPPDPHDLDQRAL